MTLREFKGLHLPKLYRAHYKLIERTDFRQIFHNLLVSGNGDTDLEISDELFDTWLREDVEDEVDESIPADRLVFFAVGGVPAITGIYLKLNLCDMHNRITTQKGLMNIPVTQPAKASHVMRLYLDNQIEIDPFAQFVTENIVLDSNALESEKRILCASGILLSQYLSNVVTNEMLGKSATEMYEEELYRLYGKMNSPALSYVSDLQRRAGLDTLGAGLHVMFDSAVREAMDTMMGGICYNSKRLHGAYKCCASIVYTIHQLTSPRWIISARMSESKIAIQTLRSTTTT